MATDPHDHEPDDDHDYCGDGDGCTTCESMGLCPTCGSASPWRCGCNDDDEDEEEDDE